MMKMIYHTFCFQLDVCNKVIEDMAFDIDNYQLLNFGFPYLNCYYTTVRKRLKNAYN